MEIAAITRDELILGEANEMVVSGPLLSVSHLVFALCC